MFIFTSCVWYIDWIFYFVFITIIVNASKFFFSILWINVFSFYWKFLSLFAKTLSDSVIRARWWCAGFKYLTKHHLKHSFSSVFWVLVNPFLEWFNSLGNFIKLLPAKRLYFEILIVWSMAVSVIQLKPFSKDFCVFFIIVV